MMFAGAFLFIAAVAMLSIKTPRPEPCGRSRQAACDSVRRSSLQS